MTMQRTARLTDYPYVELRQARGEVIVERPVSLRSFGPNTFLLFARSSSSRPIEPRPRSSRRRRWREPTSGGVSTMESPAGYVYRIGVNLNRHRLRHLAVRARRAVTLRRESVSGEAAELRIELAEAIASLSRGQREAFMLVVWLGLSAEESARILGLAPASV